MKKLGQAGFEPATNRLGGDLPNRYENDGKGF